MSCIDLLFCTDQNTVPSYGVDFSIFDKCHHNIIFCKVNIHIPLPPGYICKVWNYRQVNVQNVKCTISSFNWGLRKIDLIKILEKSTECAKKNLEAKKQLYTLIDY